MNKNSKTKSIYFLIFCVVFSLFIASVVTAVERKARNVETETTSTPPVPQTDSSDSSDSSEPSESKNELPNQVHYIAGWDKCLDILGIDCDVAFLGDSITYKNWFNTDFPDLTICSLAVSSDTIKGVNARIGTLETIRPEKVFLMIGINSLHNDNIDECVEDYKELVDNIKSKGDFDLFLISITPMAKSESGTDDPSPDTIIAFNQKIAEIAEENDATYLDLHSELEDSGYIRPEYTTDGLHLSEEAYDVWADLMRPYLEED